MNPDTPSVPQNDVASKTIVPEWIWTTDVDALPANLQWYSGDYPPIGCYGELIRAGKVLIEGYVTHYFHAGGNLHLIIRNYWVKQWADSVEQNVIALFNDEFVRFVDEDGDDIMFTHSGPAEIARIEALRGK